MIGRLLRLAFGGLCRSLFGDDRSWSLEQRLFEERGTVETGLLTREELRSLEGRVIYGVSTRGRHVCRAIDPGEAWPPAVLPAATAPWTVESERIHITGGD